MRLLILLLLSSFSVLAAVPTNSARIGNYPTATMSASNYLLGVTHANSNGATKLFSPGDLIASGLTNNLWVRNETEFTNAVKNLVSGGKIEATPRRYHILNTGLTYLTNSLNYDFGGSPIIWGTGTTEFPVFKDIGAAAAATSNSIWGGMHVLSNSGSIFINITNANTRVDADVISIWNPGSPANTLIYQEAGTLNLTIRDFARNHGYDLYWHAGARPAKVFIKCPRVDIFDTVLELEGGSSAFAPGDARFEIGEINSLGSGNLLFMLNEAGYLKFDSIRGAADSQWGFAGADPTNTFVLEGGTIYGCAMDLSGYAKFINTTFSNVNLSMGFSGLTLADCRINTSAATSFGGTVSRVMVEGALTMNKAPVSGIAINGGDVLYEYGPWTNTISGGGTNLPISLDHFTHQVAVITNHTLLILTNSPALLSGKKINLTLYNNQTTNVGIWVTSANRRLFGTDAALLNANSGINGAGITNGRSMTIEAQLVGTNITLKVEHQR